MREGHLKNAALLQCALAAVFLISCSSGSVGGTGSGAPGGGADPGATGGGGDGTGGTGGGSGAGGGGGAGAVAFPAGCAANTLKLQQGQGCTATCGNCDCTSINYVCDKSCYQAGATCLITADSNGTATAPTLMNNCTGLACTPENDLSKTLACSATDCKQPVVTPPAPPNPPTPPKPQLCTVGGVNNEPQILAGYSPASGQAVMAHGQIKVWVTDENAPFIAPNEQVDLATGLITTPGDRTAKAPDGYLWEPALYIAPQSAETGGTPYFPVKISGDFNNKPPNRGSGQHSQGMDTPPAGTNLGQAYDVEYTWDVDSLGLKPGSYIAEFVIWDGDHDRGVGCVNIIIQ